MQHPQCKWSTENKLAYLESWALCKLSCKFLNSSLFRVLWHHIVNAVCIRSLSCRLHTFSRLLFVSRILTATRLHFMKVSVQILNSRHQFQSPHLSRLLIYVVKKLQAECCHCQGLLLNTVSHFHCFFFFLFFCCDLHLPANIRLESSHEALRLNLVSFVFWT